MDTFPAPFERRRSSAWSARVDGDSLGFDSVRIVAKGLTAIFIIFLIQTILFGHMYLDQCSELTETRIRLASERAANQALREQLQQLQQQKNQPQSPARSPPAQR